MTFYSIHQQDLYELGNAAVEHSVVNLRFIVTGIEGRLKVWMPILQLFAHDVQLVRLHVRLYYCESDGLHHLWCVCILFLSQQVIQLLGFEHLDFKYPRLLWKSPKVLP